MTGSDSEMSAAIPLIRGFALLPTLQWLAREGASVERALAEVDLSMSPITDPLRPIPLAHVAAQLRNAAREHGPDLPCRVVSQTSSLEVAMLGRVALGARTPGEALARIVAALPYYARTSRCHSRGRAANMSCGSSSPTSSTPRRSTRSFSTP